jgi:hypothetical protein
MTSPVAVRHPVSSGDKSLGVGVFGVAPGIGVGVSLGVGVRRGVGVGRGLCIRLGVGVGVGASVGFGVGAGVEAFSVGMAILMATGLEKAPVSGVAVATRQ